MAEGEIIPASMLQFNTADVQSFGNFILWMVFGVIVIVILGYVIYQLYRRFQYKYHVTIHKKVGDIAIKTEDVARKISDEEGNYLFHYLNLNKRSPVVNDDFLKIVKKSSMMGLLKRSMLGFDAWYQDGKIIPMQYNYAYKNNEKGYLKIEHVSLTGIDYDSFNFLQSQIKAIIQKYERVDRLIQLLPYLSIFLVIMAFIVGSVLYGNHIQKVSETILGYSKEVAQAAVESTKAVQVLKGG